MSEENKNLSGSIPLMNPIRNAMGGYITSSDQIYDSKRDLSQEEVNDYLYDNIGTGGSITVKEGDKDWFYIRISNELPNPEEIFSTIIPNANGDALDGDSDYQNSSWMPKNITVSGFVCDDWSKTPKGVSASWAVEYETYRQRKENGFWDAIRIPTIRSMRGADGISPAAPAGILTSFIFKQVKPEETPEKPTPKEKTEDGVTYNIYNNPVPPKSEGWTDGIVANGSNPIYFSKRIFTSNGEDPQEAEWSTPKIISDSAEIEYMFSNLKKDEEGKGLKHDYDGITFKKDNSQIDPSWLEKARENGWYDEVADIEELPDQTKRTVWRMAITNRNPGGIWSPWEISQIRGEDGNAGTKFTIKGNVETYADLLNLKNLVINDAYTVNENGHLYIWDGDSWIDCGKFNGDSAYLHVIYANLSNANEEGAFDPMINGARIWLKLTNSDGETAGEYIGIYVDNNIEDPIEPDILRNKYKWQFCKGEDGFGFEYIYKATEKYEAPKVPDPDYSNSKWNDFDFVPNGWEDNPISVDGTDGYKYCWVCHRTYANNKWNEWKGKDGHATLYSRYSKDIQPNLLLNSGFDRYTEVGSSNPTESTPTIPTPILEEIITSTTTTPMPGPNYGPFLCPYTNKYKIENWVCSDDGVTLAIDEGIDGTTILWVNQAVQRDKVLIIESPVTYLSDFNKDSADLYTLSFYVKGKAKLNVEILDVDEEGKLFDSSTDIVIDQNKEDQKSCSWNWEINTQSDDNIGKWERHTFTFGIDGDVIRKALKIRFNFALKEGENHQSILLCMPKLERSEIPTAWCANKADLTGEGLGIFNSTVFTRTNNPNTIPNNPSGGYYYNPLPDDNSWSDSIPELTGDNYCVWSSMATFRSNDPIDKVAEWSKPKLMVDTDTMDIEWSTVKENPGNPTDNPSNWFNDVNEKTEGSEIYWMAIRYRYAANESYGDWIISKVKGEDGKNGLSPEENLLDNTSLFDENWSDPTIWEIRDGGLSGHKIQYCNRSDSGLSSPFSQIITSKLTKNYWHILSFYVKGTGTVAAFIKEMVSGITVVDQSEFYLDGKLSSIGFDGGHNYVLGEGNNDKWQRRYAVFKTNSGNWNESEVQLRFSVRGTSEVSICMPKLERVVDQVNPQSAMPTPWCKSQNDIKGGEGPAGERGPLLYPQGTWVATETYTRTKESAPFVYHERDGKQKYYVLEKEDDCKGIEPGTDEGKEYWGEFTNIKYVFTEALMAKWAKLGEAVFYGDYMFSQEGITSGGKIKNYGEEGIKGNIFDNDGKLSGDFVPNLFLDFNTGAIKMNKISEPFNQAENLVDENGGNIYKIDLNKGHNVTVQKAPYMVCMPNPTDIIDSEGKVVVSRGWDTDGVRSCIIVQPDFEYQLHKADGQLVWDGTSSYGYAVKQYLTILCADGRIMDADSYKNKVYKPQNVLEYVGSTSADTKTGQGYFVINGQLSKFLVLEPSAIVTLRSCTTKMGDEEVVYWYVENQSDFERVKLTVFIMNQDTFVCDYDGMGNWIGSEYDNEVAFGSKYLRTLLDADGSFSDAVELKYTVELDSNIIYYNI